MIPEIRVHPEEGFIAARDRPDSDRPWAKVVPGISLTDEDVAGWQIYGPACCDLHGRNCEPPSELCCLYCTESAHPDHRDGAQCSSPDLSAGNRPWRS